MDQITRASNNLKLQLEHQIVKPQQSAAASKGFADVLKGELDKNDGVKFSKHAMERIQSRGVDMSQQTLDSLNRAVTKARAKGCKDIAVIGEANAFIVSVQNNTVITTMNALEMRENIFTNIDSAVLL